MAHWKVLESKELLRRGFFRLREDRCQLPDGRVMPHYYVIEFADWVNVLPITRAGQVIAIEQYRHASSLMHLEIPGGSMDPKSGEEPQTAGQRELLEETGYLSNRWISCGFHYPNPALQSNRLHTFIALDCDRVAAPNLDPFEDLKVVEFPLADLETKVIKGEISHSLIYVSVRMALDKLRSENLLGPSPGPRT